MAKDAVAIGELRWPVLIARRVQSPADDQSIDETLVNPIRVRAKVEALYATTFYGAAQTDRPVTHMIWIRWLDWLDTTCVVIRDTNRPDRTVRREIFRVRRIKEPPGPPRRFLILEVESESRSTV